MRKLMVVMILICCLIVGMTTAMASYNKAGTRVKDVAKVQGVRSNQLVGYGLVVGLNGTGDSNKILQTMQSLSSMLKTFGVTVSAASMQSKNVAAVIVTAELPPFVKSGDTIDMTISSMGDAKSLQGGTLLQTPLRAANGQVYAVGQGPVVTGGLAAGGGGGGHGSGQRNFPTVGMTSNGAIVERDVPTQFVVKDKISLVLSHPDFTTANRISDAINSSFGNIASPLDPGTVSIAVPSQYGDNTVSFIAAIEELYISPDQVAKIIINERTGTIVMGANVSIDSVAVSQGGLSIRINKEQPPVPTSPPADGAATAEVKEERANVMMLPATTNVGDVVKALNGIGATPRDIISILQAMKAAGALHAELQII